MKSARRQARAARKTNSERKNNFSFVKFFIPLLVILFVYLFLQIMSTVWNGRDKVSIVYVEENGDVGVTVLDPKLSEITTLVIPADTQVDVARNYGTFRIKNVWQLGVNEKYKGSLLADTVTQNFLFPVFLWDERPPHLEKGSVGSTLKFIFLPGQTNISFADRVYIGFLL
jgi:hypothetical protein